MGINTPVMDILCHNACSSIFAAHSIVYLHKLRSLFHQVTFMYHFNNVCMCAATCVYYMLWKDQQGWDQTYHLTQTASDNATVGIVSFQLFHCLKYEKHHCSGVKSVSVSWNSYITSVQPPISRHNLSLPSNWLSTVSYTRPSKPTIWLLLTPVQSTE